MHVGAHRAHELLLRKQAECRHPSGCASPKCAMSSPEARTQCACGHTDDRVRATGPDAVGSGGWKEACDIRLPRVHAHLQAEPAGEVRDTSSAVTLFPARSIVSVRQACTGGESAPACGQMAVSGLRRPRPPALEGVWSNNSADGQRLEGVLVLGWNPPDSRSNLFASGSMSARRSWLLIGQPAEGEAGKCLDQTLAAGVQWQVVMEVGKGIRQRGGSSTAACRPVAHGTRSCRLCNAIRRPVR